MRLESLSWYGILPSKLCIGPLRSCACSNGNDQFAVEFSAGLPVVDNCHNWLFYLHNLHYDIFSLLCDCVRPPPTHTHTRARVFKKWKSGVGCFLCQAEGTPLCIESGNNCICWSLLNQYLYQKSVIFVLYDDIFIRWITISEWVRFVTNFSLHSIARAPYGWELLR